MDFGMLAAVGAIVIVFGCVGLPVQGVLSSRHTHFTRNCRLFKPAEYLSAHPSGMLLYFVRPSVRQWVSGSETVSQCSRTCIVSLISYSTISKGRCPEPDNSDGVSGPLSSLRLRPPLARLCPSPSTTTTTAAAITTTTTATITTTNIPSSLSLRLHSQS